jgi:hypothetical protein
MAKTELKTQAANVALRAAAIVGVMYGFGFLLMPSAMFQLSGDPGVPANPGWVRWAGGFVLGIAIGPWLASEMGKGGAVHSWCRGSLYSVRPRAAL